MVLVFPKKRCPDFESLVKIIEGLVVVAPVRINLTYIVEGRGDIGMVFPEKFQSYLESFTVIFEDCVIVANMMVNNTYIVEKSGNIGMFLTILRHGDI